jgi:hypothetical protein
MTGPKLTVIEGQSSLDLIEALTDALERARRGELEGIVLAFVEDGGVGSVWAVREDCQNHWPHLAAAAQCAADDCA